MTTQSQRSAVHTTGSCATYALGGLLVVIVVAALVLTIAGGIK